MYHYLMTHDAFWVRLVSDDRLLDVAEQWVRAVDVRHGTVRQAPGRRAERSAIIPGDGHAEQRSA